jgi:hypothetical protein
LLWHGWGGLCACLQTSDSDSRSNHAEEIRMKRLHVHVSVDDLGQSIRGPGNAGDGFRVHGALGTKLRAIGRIEGASSSRLDVA